MTAEELEAVLKAVNANRPQQTMNFNAPIGETDRGRGEICQDV